MLRKQLNSELRWQALSLYQLFTNRHVLKRWHQLQQSQWLSPAELQTLQKSKLQQLLAYAYAYVPYYQRLFKEVGFHPNDLQNQPASFRKIPLLSKEIINQNFDDLTTTHQQLRRQLSRASTSGSTGRPLVFLQDNNFRDHVMAGILRSMAWTGWEWGDCQAYIWGASFEVTTGKSVRTQLMDLILNRFVTNAYILSEESMANFATQIRHRRPRLLFGYVSGIYRFAEFVRANKLKDIKFQAIISSAEILFPHQRQFIEETFGGQVFDRYGTREVGELGCECEYHQKFHVSVENSFVEIEHDDGPAQPGEQGHIIVTNLNNYGMPFIRYALADVGTWQDEGPCPCGRSLPRLGNLQGRHNDLFKRQDGTLIWGGFDRPLWQLEGVKQFQIIQKSFDRVLVRIVKRGTINQASLDKVVRAVKFALGNSTVVDFEFPTEIPLERSGKTRYQISEVNKEG